MPSIVSEYQILTKIQQNFKKSIMMIIGACVFLIAYSLLGFVVGLITLTVICAVGIALIILKQMKGLHTKHEFQGILIYRRDSEI